MGVTFYDFRNNTAADGILATDQFAVHCHADCTQTASWAETQVTPTSFDMRRAPFARGYFVGDYEGLGFIADDGAATAPGDAFASFFSQSHGADRRARSSAGWHRSRNGTAPGRPGRPGAPPARESLSALAVSA